MFFKKHGWVILYSFVLFLIMVLALIMVKTRKVPPDASSIKLINDYNQGVGIKNLCGGAPFTFASKDAFAKMRYSKEDAFKGSGYSIEISFYVPLEGWSAWGEDLNELDISAAQDVSFKIKGGKGDERFEFHIKDKEGHEAGVDIWRYARITNSWQTATIPLGDFKDINFNHLDSIIFIFRGDSGEKTGSIYIDNVSFTGKSELFFNSIRDNLKRFPAKVYLNKRRRQLAKEKSNEKLLLEIAKDTWVYFRDVYDVKRALPADWIKVYPDRGIGDYASPTNIGLYFLSVISAFDLGLISKGEAVSRIKSTLEVIEGFPKWKGFLYNFYNTTNLQITHRYISSVDNAWFTVALAVVREAFPELSGVCTKLLNDQNYLEFYNRSLGQINLGYDAEERCLSPYNYGLLCAESRIISVVGIGKGDLPKEHWFKIFRTLPEEWSWQAQMPKGVTKKYIDVEVFEGYYTYEDIKIVPSWGGSLFEFLMSTLVVKEKELAPNSLGLNNLRAVEAHIKYAKEKDYPVWGISPCSTPDGSYGGYSEFGVVYIGAKGYKDEGVVTPHAAFLALDPAPKEAIRNIRKFLNIKDIYGELGFYDAINVKTKQVSTKYFALDQGMILCAINNYLNNGILKERFHKDPIGRRFEELLAIEEFSIGE